ncbi:hypothetical protein DGM85_00605 [Xanthomonas phaseoli pv. phaseoli]|nr:hypothetical protein DGM93_22085 [Xanthomonas phaseoli pv. phaseoli]QWN27276.1 hypothetical protein DGM85_00605 [Xanthomonas phaseoli pv. phaseoli]QWN34924.1 hypothetical protein DGM81_21845 [Xanthomonas phaseoli pv. phaseoli]
MGNRESGIGNRDLRLGIGDSRLGIRKSGQVGIGSESPRAKENLSPSPPGRGVGVRVRRQTANPDKPSHHLNCSRSHRRILPDIPDRAQPCTVILQLRATLSRRRTTEVCCCPTRRKPLSPRERGWGEGTAEDSQPEQSSAIT